MKYERLFSPINVGSMTLKNRIIMVAMHHLYTENGLSTPRFNEYYWKRAEGGAAMLIVGACRFDDYGSKLSTMSLRTDDTIPGWKKFTDGVHDRGCKAAVQLYHAGRYMPKADVPCGDEALAPSAVYASFTRETARAMTQAEIEQVIEDWAAAAVRARTAGFDAVEILGSAGYLISQFLSPATNLRTDKYGEDRGLFPIEVINAVRKAVGKDYPLILRIAGNDLVKGSNTSDDAVRFALRAEAAGIDMFDVTGGWHESRVPQLTGEVPRAGLMHLGKAIKDAVSIPVAMANRINDPVVAEEALALGRTDIIAMGRPLLADPELPIKALSGREDELRHCVACNQGCLANTFFDKPITCLVNGLAGREYQLKKEKAVQPKKVLVVGGGPAGCEFALRAAERGHEVTLWERTDRLGGQLKLTAPIPARYEFSSLISYYETMLKRAGVKVTFEKEAVAADILAGGFEAVALAMGREPKPIKLPVLDDAVPVYMTTEVIRGDVMPGKRIVVIGGSFVGLETARMLARQGSISADELFYLTVNRVEKPEKISSMLNTSDREITVIEALNKLGAGYESGVAWPVFADLARLGVAQHKGTKVIEINSDGVVAENADGRFAIACDCVVFAVGSETDLTLYQQLKDKLPWVTMIGNHKKLGRAINAINDAVTMAWEL